MGSLFAKMIHIMETFSTKPHRILLLGLDAAGKTTILYQLKLHKSIDTSPTIGFNVETFHYNNVQFTVWDIGGQEILRSYWKSYYQNTHAVIFVVDSNDSQRTQQASEELHRMFQEYELKDAKLLVYANKQDLPNALTPSQIVEKMNLRGVTSNPWFIQPCSAMSASGLNEGLHWLSKALD